MADTTRPVEKRNVWRLYEDFADRYDADRQRHLMERAWLSEVFAHMPGRRVLDLGCGMGEPIANYFVEAGCQVTGVDASPAMIARCRMRFPEHAWHVADMRGLTPGQLGAPFDAVLAWNSLFHLPADDQADMFQIFGDQAAAGAMLLFTSGPDAGEAIGEMYGQPLFHASLSPEDYRRLLADAGFETVRFTPDDPDCGRHCVWLARKAPPVGHLAAPRS